MHLYGGGQEVTLTRDCKAIQIPNGTPVLLEKGQSAYITQILGGMFTVETEMGYLARIDGKDADALGQPVPPESQPVPENTGKTLEQKAWDQLRTCYDPEIPVNIVELGLIYECRLSPLEDQPGKYRADVQLTLTAPGCGMGEVLKSDVENKLLDIPEIEVANVEVVLDPPWESAMMSEAARLQLGMM